MKHYIPILKWKRAEQGALRALADEYKKCLSPLIELVMPKPKTPFKDEKEKIKKTRDELFQELIQVFREKRMSEIIEEIAENWGFKRAYIDFTLLYTVELKIESLKKIIRRLSIS